MPRRINDRGVYMRALEVAERQLIEWAIKQTVGRPEHTAGLLQISEQALYVRCHRVGILTPGKWWEENIAKIRASMGFVANEEEYGFLVAPVDEINEREKNEAYASFDQKIFKGFNVPEE